VTSAKTPTRCRSSSKCWGAASRFQGESSPSDHALLVCCSPTCRGAPQRKMREVPAGPPRSPQRAASSVIVVSAAAGSSLAGRIYDRRCAFSRPPGALPDPDGRSRADLSVGGGAISPPIAERHRLPLGRRPAEPAGDRATVRR
jgi:hypothetical protein